MFKTILLTITWLLFIGGKTPEIGPSLEDSDETFKCSLPNPKNFQLTSSGSTYLIFRWEPVPGAAYYRLKVYHAATKIMVSSRLVTALPRQNGAEVNGLTPGVTYNVEIRSVCSNGIESPKQN